MRQVRIPTAPSPHETWTHANVRDFSRQFGNGGCSEIAQTLVLIDFFELAQSGGSEQNSVSIALKPLYEGAFFNLWSGDRREKPNQINGLSSGIEELKL